VQSGEWKTAIPLLKKTLELSPEKADAAYDLGKALLLAEDPSGAITWLQRAATLNPADPSPHYLLARAFDKSGRPEDARAERQRFAELKKAQPQTGGMASGPTQ
jgi:Flp pilus assembly protein TadD